MSAELYRMLVEAIPLSGSPELCHGQPDPRGLRSPAEGVPMKKTELDHQIIEENTAVTEEPENIADEGELEFFDQLFGCMKDDIEILGDIVSPIYADWVKLCSS
jgi:hypothetical protein